MAPQNSTLIHENVESTTSDLSCYSPILPLKKKEGNGGKTSSPSSRSSSSSTATKTGNDIHQRNKKSICSKPINSIIHQENDLDEIPIWICGEPRFVSGVTSTTTCNDIIEALIEDELQQENNDVAASRDYSDYVITERWRDVEQALSGDTYILPIWKAWGNVRNEVKLKLKINKNQATTNNGESEPTKQSHVKKEKINIIRKLMRKIIKQGETIQDHLSLLNEKNMEKKRLEKIRKSLKYRYGKKLLLNSFLNEAASSSLGSQIDEKCPCCRKHLCQKDVVKSNAIPREFPNFLNNAENDEDELILVLENNDDLDSGVHFGHNRPKLRVCNTPRSKHDDDRLLLEPIQSLSASVEEIESIRDTPKRKRRSVKDYTELKNHNLNQIVQTRTNIMRPDFKITSIQFDTIRKEIAAKMTDLNELLKREEELIFRLETKCAKYKAENELYSTKLGLELQIDEVQGNLESYAKDIVQSELDLYRAKLEIQEKCSILDDLKDILKIKLPGENLLDDLEIRENLKKKIIKNTPISFVDNVYEFCDNNESMIV